MTILPLLCSLIIYAGNSENNNYIKTEIQSMNYYSSYVFYDFTINDTAGNDFQKFWIEFRQSILDNDTDKIKSFTKFPIKSRGPLDYDPVKSYSKTKFTKVFKIFLAQNNGFYSGSELDEIKLTTKPKDPVWEKINARVGDMVFKKIADKWKLVFLYLDNEAISAIGE